MDFAVLLLTFTVFWKSSSSLRCYTCSAGPTDSNACLNFNSDDSYVTDCPKSTICVKKETMLIALGESTKTVERTCAQQTFRGDQVKINDRWVQVTRIYEVYKEGCAEESNELGRPTKTTYCFCRGDLCNGSSRHLGVSVITLAVSFIVILFNL